MVAARHTFDHVDSTRRNFSAPAGSAVVEDPRNGQVLALATNPTYDPAEFVGGISQANYQALLNNPSDPLLDRTIQGQYAPGSTFKLITATAGLQYRAHHPLDGLRRHGVHHHRQLRRPQRQRGRLRPDHPAHRHHGVERQLLQHHRPQPLVRPRPLRRRRPAERGQAVRPGIAHRDRPAQRGRREDPHAGVLHPATTRPIPACSPRPSGIRATATRWPSGRTKCW